MPVLSAMPLKSLLPRARNHQFPPYEHRQACKRWPHFDHSSSNAIHPSASQIAYGPSASRKAGPGRLSRIGRRRSSWFDLNCSKTRWIGGPTWRTYRLNILGFPWRIGLVCHLQVIQFVGRNHEEIGGRMTSIIWMISNFRKTRLNSCLGLIHSFCCLPIEQQEMSLRWSRFGLLLRMSRWVYAVSGQPDLEPRFTEKISS